MRIDGVEQGQTPLQTELPAGQHTIVVHDTGWNEEPRILVVTADGPNELDVKLTPKAETPLPQRTRRTHLRLGIASTAAGVVLARHRDRAAGMDGKGACSGPGECPKVYDTSLLGGLSLGVGAVAVGAGIYWLTRKRSDQAPPRAAFPVPTPGGAALVMAGTY